MQFDQHNYQGVKSTAKLILLLSLYFLNNIHDLLHNLDVPLIKVTNAATTDGYNFVAFKLCSGVGGSGSKGSIIGIYELVQKAMSTTEKCDANQFYILNYTKHPRLYASSIVWAA